MYNPIHIILDLPILGILCATNYIFSIHYKLYIINDIASIY